MAKTGASDRITKIRQALIDADERKAKLKAQLVELEKRESEWINDLAIKHKLVQLSKEDIEKEFAAIAAKFHVTKGKAKYSETNSGKN